VLGVSKDPVPALKRFRNEHGLRHTLLSDEDHAVAEAYGAWVQKSMYGRTHMGVARSTFVIDSDGRVVHVIAKANPRSHDDEVLEALATAA
jgi:peroxiredoxin Q/BCP